MQDPSTMTDEELDAAIAAPPEEPVQEEVATASPQEEQPETPAEPEAPVAEAETPAEEEPIKAPAPSRRETLRVQQLLQKYGQPPKEQPAPSQPAPNAPNYQEMIEADQSVYDQLGKVTQEFGAAERNQGYAEGLKKAEFYDWKTSLKIDAPQVESRYKFLDQKDTENFHPALADSLNTWYLKMSGFDQQSQTVQNPGIGYADFVDSIVELAEEIAGDKSATSAKNITKQVAMTGLRPDGSAPKRLNLNKPPEQMTDEELDAVIAQGIPKK